MAATSMAPDGLVLLHTLSPPAPGEGTAALDAPAGDALMEEHVFQTFYRAHNRALWSYLYRMVGNAAQADDALQEAFVKFLSAPVGNLGESEQRAYLFRIATNLVIDQYRRRTREQQALERWQPDEAALQQAAVLRASSGQAGAMSIDMTRTFAELKPRERTLLWLAYVEGSEHDEIARSLGLKPKSIRVLLFRAKKRLAALLRKKGLGADA
jgi:RNA polymerase sigma-70 factor (ECF subfamily)